MTDDPVPMRIEARGDLEMNLVKIALANPHVHPASAGEVSKSISIRLTMRYSDTWKWSSKNLE
jgi:hypothetical protein